MSGFELDGEFFTRWLSEQNGEPVRSEAEPGDEQVLPQHALRELDGLPPALDRSNRG